MLFSRILHCNYSDFESLQMVAAYNTQQLIQCYNLYIVLNFETRRSLYTTLTIDKNPFSQPEAASQELINLTPTTTNHQFGLKLANKTVVDGQHIVACNE